MKTYTLIRFYKDSAKPSRVLMTGLTLEEAKEHCNDPSTEKEGEWFDAFKSEDN